MHAFKKELSSEASVRSKKNIVHIRVKGNQNYCISTVVGSASNDVKVLAEIARYQRHIESQAKQSDKVSECQHAEVQIAEILYGLIMY